MLYFSLQLQEIFPAAKNGEKEFMTFQVNKPSSYRRKPNWYLRFRHRNK